MPRYKTVLIGCGPRGVSHAEGFLRNADRFELVACCDRKTDQRDALAARLSIPRTYDDAGTMLAREKPDVLCFATKPHIRLSLVELGLEHGVKAIAFEKPMATELAEARAIHERCREAGVRIVLSHQHKYGPHWQKAREIVASGEIGAVTEIHATARAWASLVATHLIDYMLWFNGGRRASWAIGQALGTQMLSSQHPAPDFLFGILGFENGVRGRIECGAHAPRHMPPPNSLRDRNFYLDNALTVHGTHGYVRVVSGDGWRAVTRSSGGEVLRGEGGFDSSHDQPLYLRDLADWLDDPAKVHPCDGEICYHGFEVLTALLLGALDRRRVALPLGDVADGSLIQRLRKELPPSDEYQGQ